ncbi:MAG: T9SS type A sorting domain-containing protein [Bacteroidetes bacterium]|nr:T9SS type A sorting domain-containing protein [Bacteroidota bacterium]
MKKYFFTIILAALCNVLMAQLYVGHDATLYIGGNVTLNNADFIHESGAGPDILFGPGSNVLFKGNADNMISGYINFLNLEIAKDGTHMVSLQDFNEDVRGQMVFTSGLFNLNNRVLRLISPATLVNENENSRIIGPTGGSIETSLTLNQPSGVNPANIGATITSNKNLGEITIYRNYIDPYTLPAAAIKRYYSINFTTPANDNNLDATLRLAYFDAELNGADETKLVHWKREDLATTWLQQGTTINTTRNMVDDWVELSGIGSLSFWTLAENSGALPVEFTYFDVACAGSSTVLRWQTATEINTDHFEIQKSKNATDWITIATQTAAGQSSSLQDYKYIYTTPSAKTFYRIQSVDRDGLKKYTSVKVSNCSIDESWKVWPNPVQKQLYISMKLDKAYKAFVQLFDNKGSLVRHWEKQMVYGNNQFAIDMKDLSSGTYQLVISWDNGRIQKNTIILKQ